jgi:hypothetical protein
MHAGDRTRASAATARERGQRITCKAGAQHTFAKRMAYDLLYIQVDVDIVVLMASLAHVSRVSSDRGLGPRHDAT